MLQNPNPNPLPDTRQQNNFQEQVLDRRRLDDQQQYSAYSTNPELPSNINTNMGMNGTFKIDHDTNLNVLVYGQPDASTVYFAAQVAQMNQMHVSTFWTDKSGLPLRPSSNVSDNANASIANLTVKVNLGDININVRRKSSNGEGDTNLSDSGDSLASNVISLAPNALDIGSNMTEFDIVILSLGSLRDLSRAKRALHSIILANKTLVLVNCTRNPPLQQFVREKLPQSLAICAEGLFYADSPTAPYTSSHSSNSSLLYHAEVEGVLIEPLEVLNKIYGMGSANPSAMSTFGSNLEYVKAAFSSVLTYDYPQSQEKFLARQWAQVIPVIALECLTITMDTPNIHDLVQSVVARPLIDGLIKELTAIARAQGAYEADLPRSLDDIKWQNIKTVIPSSKTVHLSRSPVIFHDFYFHHHVPVDLMLLYPILMCDDLAEKGRSNGLQGTSYLESLFAFMTTLSKINDTGASLSAAKDKSSASASSNASCLFARLDMGQDLRAPVRSSSSSTSCSSPDSLELSLTSAKSSAATSTTSVSDLRAREEAIVAKEQALYTREKVLYAKETEVNNKMAANVSESPTGNFSRPKSNFPMSPGQSPLMSNVGRHSMQQRKGGYPSTPNPNGSFSMGSPMAMANGYFNSEPVLQRPRLVSSSASMASFNMYDPSSAYPQMGGGGGGARDIDMMSVTSRRRVGSTGHGPSRRPSMMPSASTSSLVGLTATDGSNGYRYSQGTPVPGMSPGTPYVPWSQKFTLDGAIFTSENDRYAPLKSGRRLSGTIAGGTTVQGSPMPGPTGFASQQQLPHLRTYSFSRKVSS